MICSRCNCSVVSRIETFSSPSIFSQRDPPVKTKVKEIISSSMTRRKKGGRRKKKKKKKREENERKLDEEKRKKKKQSESDAIIIVEQSRRLIKFLPFSFPISLVDRSNFPGINIPASRTSRSNYR